ncbi:hypothetical protein FTUN_7771 [Frigoriglobus tundricola]|uniref:Uncharacterized protein n=1 Tax=Frigoriglobus tundricola TaxID=2774151 RepID=A0A6M5Z333_9BACT|nr:hypothetical protein FTUN_7771 [Frigoriglobus tundricola]
MTDPFRADLNFSTIFGDTVRSFPPGANAPGDLTSHTESTRRVFCS